MDGTIAGTGRAMDDDGHASARWSDRSVMPIAQRGAIAGLKPFDRRQGAHIDGAAHRRDRMQFGRSDQGRRNHDGEHQRDDAHPAQRPFDRAEQRDSNPPRTNRGHELSPGLATSSAMMPTAAGLPTMPMWLT